MKRAVGFLGTVVLLLLIFGLYTGVNLVKEQEKALRELDAKISKEAEEIRVLKADWSYFNQPERLQLLARQHLKLMPTAPSQIVIMARLPERDPQSTPDVKAIQPSQLPFRASESTEPKLPKSIPSKGPTTQVSP